MAVLRNEGREHRWRSIAQAALLVSAAALCILLAPPPPRFQQPLICAEVVPIGERAHIMANCDADSFTELARAPSRLLEANSVRQSRPGYVALGWLMSIPFRAIHPAASFNPYYAGYVTLNWISMILSLMLLADLIGARSLLGPAAVAPVSLLLVNHITKAFFWTPHQQVISLFSAMAAMWIARRTINVEGRISVRAAALLGLIAGVACLVYGAFILVPASVTIALWMFCSGESRLRRLRVTFVLWLAALSPFVAWRAFVVERTGTFYSHETRYYHEFVWFTERLKEGPSSLWSALGGNVVRFLDTFPAALGLPLAFLALAFLLAVTRNRKFPKPTFNNVTVRSATSFLLAAAPFYALMGFYDPRLTAVLIAPLVVLAGSALRDSFRSDSSAHVRGLPEPITLAAIAYAAIVVLLRGPYA